MPRIDCRYPSKTTVGHATIKFIVLEGAIKRAIQRAWFYFYRRGWRRGNLRSKKFSGIYLVRSYDDTVRILPRFFPSRRSSSSTYAPRFLARASATRRTRASHRHGSVIPGKYTSSILYVLPPVKINSTRGYVPYRFDAHTVYGEIVAWYSTCRLFRRHLFIVHLTICYL